jgi:hypothetical protein
MKQKFRLKVDHLPSNQQFYTEFVEADEDNTAEDIMDRLENLCQKIVDGEVSHVSNNADVNKDTWKELWYLPKKILSESVIYIERITW